MPIPLLFKNLLELIGTLFHHKNPENSGRRRGGKEREGTVCLVSGSQEAYRLRT